ncbi:LOW QUALITY PROTEIN: hypothetical protein Cgig2_029994 [Carnegiea gigantea]|uniref:Uncharacterized protein n=1 Tax=Carnegiea gigantea TaxID=171969 RepID=A0A9Q1QD99_9CARY|nr:LOW QUALITY PROTEIN: hypothetical protein Cgig2_029994 [Carnegiea gigantea]
MTFPRSLNTKEMAEYVVRHFEWDQRGITFPPSPLPKDFQALFLSYELVVAEEAAEDYELVELSQVIFYVILLNEVERLGVLHGRALRTLESALTELRWSTFESWVWLYGDRIFEAWFRTKAKLEESSGAGIHPSGGSGIMGEEEKQRMLGTPIFPFIMAFPPLYDTREMADYVRKSFIWHWRRATRPPCPLTEDYHVLCPRFSLPEAKGATADFELLEMGQATFYAMLLNEAIERVCFMAEGLKLALVGPGWSSFEAWMSRVDHELREAQL